MLISTALLPSILQMLPVKSWLRRRRMFITAAVSQKSGRYVELLLKGPLHTELKATLSPDVKILNVTLSDGAVYVNLNDAFLNGTSEISERVVVYSLVNSLLELEGTSTRYRYPSMARQNICWEMVSI